MASGALVAVHGACMGLSSRWPLAAEHELSRCTAREIFSDQGRNPRLLRWQADSLPRSHPGSPGTHTSSKVGIMVAQTACLEGAEV